MWECHLEMKVFMKLLRGEILLTNPWWEPKKSDFVIKSGFRDSRLVYKLQVKSFYSGSPMDSAQNIVKV